MQYFIGIITPTEYQQRIVKFQKRWTNNPLPGVVEPHVTLKAQGGLTEDLSWVDNVKDICSRYPSFKLSISEPRFFGKDILYLSVESPELLDLHKQLVDAVSPSRELIKQYFESDDFTGHLTLGKTHHGLTELELQEMKIEAEKSLIPFPTFDVKFVRIYREVHNKYEPFQDIQLAEMSLR